MFAYNPGMDVTNVSKFSELLQGTPRMILGGIDFGKGLG